MNQSFQILLFYHYIHIDDPDLLMQQQRQLCRDLGLTGRIIIAHEGINATVEGEAASTEVYVKALLADPRFATIHMKRSPGTGHAFPKLSIKVRPEIVAAHLGDHDIHPTRVTGKYLTPEELHTWIHEKRRFYIVDMRNDFEQRAGHFDQSVLPPLGNFRDLPKILPTLEHLRNETIVTVCTGGVRCEKASGFLVQSGFKDVYQLQGGIVSYMERYPNQDFLGKLYVFDGRILMGFNTDAPEHRVMGTCEKCGTSSENFINCDWDECHRHFICCQNCLGEHGHTYCSASCEREVATVTH
jgi:UPF0176 protein